MCNVPWFSDLEVQHWGNRAETTSLISLWSFFTWLIRMIFSHSSQGWSPRGGKSANNSFSHQVLQVGFGKLSQSLYSLLSYHNVAIANLVSVLPFWTRLCKRCGICWKNALRAECRHRGSQCGNPFWHYLKDELQWLVMKNWLLHPECIFPKSHSQKKPSLRRRNVVWWDITPLSLPAAA